MAVKSEFLDFFSDSIYCSYDNSYYRTRNSSSDTFSGCWWPGSIYGSVEFWRRTGWEYLSSKTHTHRKTHQYLVMIPIDSIREKDLDIYEYLETRQILDQYKKAKVMILWGLLQKHDFKRRKPKNEWVYQFRINQKYRAFWYFRTEGDKNIFTVTKISDHQDF